jgi:hypothetical protein
MAIKIKVRLLSEGDKGRDCNVVRIIGTVDDSGDRITITAMQRRKGTSLRHLLARSTNNRTAAAGAYYQAKYHDRHHQSQFQRGFEHVNLSFLNVDAFDPVNDCVINGTGNHWRSSIGVSELTDAQT